jgi:hypothetical protein
MSGSKEAKSHCLKKLATALQWKESAVKKKYLLRARKRRDLQAPRGREKPSGRRARNFSEARGENDRCMCASMLLILPRKQRHACALNSVANR